MKFNFVLMLSLCLIGCNRESSVNHATNLFGDAISLDSTTALSTILDKKDENIGKEFKVEGVVAEVCQKKGCWMDLKDGDNMVTVRFKYYAFFVPKDGAGRKAVIQGIFTKGNYEDTDEHGNTVNKDYYQFIASSVALEKALPD